MDSIKKKIRILIAEDSKLISTIFTKIFNAADDMEVIGHAADGEQAVNLTKKLKPDLITMDIEMPKMDGVEATKQIMKHNPTPIVVISSHANDSSMNLTFKAIEAGALTVLDKPQGLSPDVFGPMQQYLINTVRAMAAIKAIKRRSSRLLPPKKAKIPPPKDADYEVIGLGTSTGGPPALSTIFKALPKEFPLPILAVQHITPGFLPGMLKWLKLSVQQNIKLAEAHELLKPNTIYFAPDNHQLEIYRRHGKLAIKLVEGKAINGFCPSVDGLFHSLASTCPNTAIGGLLTGMGRDGAKGLLAMHQAHCQTFTQDKSGCVIHGMPQAAIDLGASRHEIALEKIADFLVQQTKPYKTKETNHD
ncbi:MAG: chemotaxis-specific protein-glutamate methyltransferase CheB [Gammaproteobacteria bacterium]|nr:chemotaxis-specific protein-glutamate methyltransferase CheB [Gammaproteobacteria bacterium]